MTYVEAKFVLRIRDSKPSDTGSRGHSDPMDVDAVNSLSLFGLRKRGSSSPHDGCFKCGGAHFQRDCNACKSTRKQSSGKGKQSKSWSKSEVKGKSKENKENPKESPKEPKVRSEVPKAHTRVKHRKLVYQVLKTRNQRPVQKLRNRDTCVPLTILGFVMLTNGMMNGMITGVRLDGTKVVNKRMTIPQAHFHLEFLISVP